MSWAAGLKVPPAPLHLEQLLVALSYLLGGELGILAPQRELAVEVGLPAPHQSSHGPAVTARPPTNRPSTAHNLRAPVLCTRLVDLGSTSTPIPTPVITATVAISAAKVASTIATAEVRGVAA